MPRPQAARRPLTISGVLGEILLTLAVLVLGYAAWLLLWTDQEAHTAWRGAVQQLESSWAPVADGTAPERRDDVPIVTGGADFAIVRIPAFGPDYAVPLSDGNGRAVIDGGGLGHYPLTDPIGSVGNAGIAGHRTSHGSPLRSADTLRPGDAIVIETQEAHLVYRVTADPIIVRPSESWVLSSPVPGVSTETDRLLTLTTCHPLFSTSRRLIVFALFDYWTLRSEGLPPDLAPTGAP